MTWNREKLEQLKRHRDAAVISGREVFTFGGQQVLVSYAGYLIEYLDRILVPTPQALRAGEKSRGGSNGC